MFFRRRVCSIYAYYKILKYVIFKVNFTAKYHNLWHKVCCYVIAAHFSIASSVSILHKHQTSQEIHSNSCTKRMHKWSRQG